MEWTFTADDVVKGDVAYTLDAFREDFMQEVSANMSQLPPDALNDCYDVLYDLTYWLATGRDLADFLASSPQGDDMGARPFLERAFLEQAEVFLAPNVEMLGALLQRMLMDRVEGGIVLEQAVAQVAREHAEVVARTPCATCAA